ncbi:MAG TPA: hypothetical protein VFJ16_11685 [Longimicrobium sp.]|nr:hypothetical protein [Longimicrobium sp.]
MAGTPDEASLKRLRRTVYRRVLRQLRASVNGSTAEQLMAALEAETPAGTIARVLSAVPAAVGTNADEWAEELLRGAEIKQELLAESGGTYSTGEVARLLGVTPQAVQQRRMRGRLLSVPLANGEWGYPACQFTPGGPPSALPRILDAFATRDPWVQLSILVSHEPALGGRLVDLVARGQHLDEVERIARSYGEQGGV